MVASNWRWTTPASANMRNRSESTLADTPATLRFSSPNRVGPLERRTQRIYVVHGPISRRNSASIGHPTGLLGTTINHPPQISLRNETKSVLLSTHPSLVQQRHPARNSKIVSPQAEI